MSNFWKRYSQQVEYVDKAQAAEDGTVYELQGIEETKGNYGPQWVVHVVRTSDNVAGKISFTRSANRDQKMNVLSEALAEGEIIEARLRTFKNKNGQTGYDFEPVENDAQQSLELNDVPF